MEEKEKTKREKDVQLKREEEKLAREMATYNPFGRQGGGAPMRDPEGHIIASRAGYFNWAPNTALVGYNYSPETQSHKYEERRSALMSRGRTAST